MQSASQLRYLVGYHSLREDVASGLQQDIMEFRNLLIYTIKNEMQLVKDTDGLSLIDQFIGKENIARNFFTFPGGRW